MMNFFTFEGGEGSGKSTQAKMLFSSFIDAGIDTLLTREPGGTDSAEAIRDLLINSPTKLHPMSQLLLLNASRYEHASNKIIPALQSKKTVICDRFVDSTMAYQGFGQKLGKKIPALLHNLLMEGLSPNLTFILDIDPEKGLKRATKNGTDNYEKLDLDFHRRVRNGFLEIANLAKNRCIIINASDRAAEIHSIIIENIKSSAGFDLKITKQ